ncbi:MAG TPA: BTAD domain-containing putative transcriptional regulator, partial [Chthonomonadaceae bacterium]|nr:BTAD domain-containing putative transcriptional regulator [Chthonomonadaceae bacterium]
ASALITHLEESGRSGEALGYARQAVSVDPLREEAHAHLMRLLSATGQPDAALRQYREMERLLETEIGAEPSPALRALSRRIEQESGLSSPTAPPVRSGSAMAAERLPGIVPVPGRPATLTFLFTDIESSTRLWEQQGEAFREALQTHHAALRAVFAQHDGQELRETGDSFLVAFQSARQALTCAIAAQQALAEAAWPAGIGLLRVRMVVHTGDVTPEGGDYHGLALHRASRILVSEATAALMQGDQGDDLRLVDLGIWRLRDVAAPQRLFQLEYPGMDTAEFPAPSAAAGYQPRLPLQSTRFFGRDEEITRLQEALNPSSFPNARLITLTGPGGTGKSRLAVAVAERLLERFQGAVWFVALADLADPERIADTILDVLRLPRSPQQEPLEQVVQALSRQPSLLVLDNFEHLLTEPAPVPKPSRPGSAKARRRTRIEPPIAEGGTRIVQALLARVPALSLLVTSRQVLGLPGEREFAVPPLPTPNGGEAPEQLSLFDSVRLFVDRAQAVLPYFQVTNANAPAVAALCDRLEGLPLAIELAAARAQVLTPAQMLSQLEHRFAFLTSRKRGVEERHRTLRAAIDWSYRLLTPELQRFFARLSVFRGGWTVEAAEAVCEAPLALDYLAELRECSLILSEESGQGMRFRMLETLREYAGECLTAEDLAATEQRHTDFYMDLVQKTWPVEVYFYADNMRVVNGSQTEAFRDGLAAYNRWAEYLAAEVDNLRAALQYSAIGAEAERTLTLALAFHPFWRVRGYYREGQQWLLAALERNPNRTAQRGEALYWAGFFTKNLKEFSSALSMHQESLDIRRGLDDSVHVAASLIEIGNVYKDQGNYPPSEPFYSEALTIAREIGEKGLLSEALMTYGGVLYHLGRVEDAHAMLEESLALSRETGAPRLQIWGLCVIASMESHQKANASAHHLFQQALSIAWQLGDRREIASLIGVFARMAVDESLAERAVRLIAAQGALFQEMTLPIPSFEELLTRLRQSLDEAAFTAAWEAGRAMTWEQAVEYALSREPE